MSASAIDTALSVLRHSGRRIHPSAISTTSLSRLYEHVRRPLKVAVVRFDGIGDWILTVPLLTALRSSAYVETVHLVAPKSWRSLLSLDDRFEIVPYSLGTILQPPWPGQTLGKIRATSFLVGTKARADGAHFRGQFDAVILPRWDTDLGQNARLWAAGTESHIIGFDPHEVPGTTRKEWREVRLLDGVVRGTSPAVHETEHLQTMLEGLGLSSAIQPGFGREFFRIDPKMAATNSLVIHPLSNEPKRQWPVDAWRILIATILSRTSFDLDLIGSSNERPLLNSLVPPENTRVRVHAGEPLSELPLRIASARAFIGNDSGPAHIAGSLNIPTVVISPHPKDGDPAHRNSPVRFAPSTDRLRIVQPAHGVDNCISSCTERVSHCILQVKPAEVFGALDSLLIETEGL